MAEAVASSVGGVLPIVRTQCRVRWGLYRPAPTPLQPDAFTVPVQLPLNLLASPCADS